MLNGVKDFLCNKWGLVLFLLILVVLVILLFNKHSEIPNTYEDKIDSLQNEINIVSASRDSIDKKIDTVTILIEKTKIQYEKDRNIILSNTVSEDYEFFIEYIGNNKERLDSISNS